MHAGLPVSAFAAGAFAVTLAGCAGTTGAPSTTQGPVECLLAPQPPSLVYPGDGATNVPDGNFTLLLTGSATPMSLEINNVVAVSDLQPTSIPSPLPTPAATASPHAAYAVPALQPATTYQVVGVYPVSGCHPLSYTPPPQPIGSFTTK